MPRSRVFISYRRDDAAGFSHAIHDRLADHLGRGQVFMDVHGIAPGADFVQRLQGVVQDCDVLVALIGRRWAGERAGGGARLHDPDDWVRIEIATALQRGIRVIPVLLDGAKMPDAADLPADLRPLLRLNALDVRATRLDADARDLVAATVRAAGGTWPPPEPGARLHAAIGGAYALFAGGALLLSMLASLFVDSLPDATLIGLLGMVAAAVVVLRLPLHPRLQALSREQALKAAAVLHAAAALALVAGSGDVEGGAVFLLGVVPAGALYLASYGMRRVARV